jgi:molybdate/tungstate transport system substrate-binding protein
MVAGDATVGRRALLAGLGGTLCGLAGCAGVVGDRATAVSMLAAGSLNNAIENGLRGSVDATLQSEVHGSAECARLVDSGQKDPDILSLADVALFDAPLSTPWYATFATNSLVVAYNPDTAGGQRIAEADRWFDPLVADSVALGRTDPALDPLGYRALFMLELATEFYDIDVDLRAAIPTREQLYPETQLISQFETGAIDAAIAYRSMATQRGYDYVDLPAAINLGDPSMADHYADVSYELPGGTVVTGAPIRYGSTVRHRSAAADAVFETHITGDYLPAFGFTVPDNYPEYTPNAPDTFTN